MTEPFVIEGFGKRVEICPESGAALGRFDWNTGENRWQAVLRPRPDGPVGDPFSLALNLLVPWSNRISGGGFSCAGRFHALKPNLAGEPFPIHGDAFQRVWHVDSREPAKACLSVIADGGPGPFRYHARVEYALTPDALEMTLSVENRAEERLPYGLGFHPWFVRTPVTALCASASHVWLEDARHLPTAPRPASDVPDWNFSPLRALPGGWINNAFAGWNGNAKIIDAGADLSIRIDAEKLLSAYVLYSPSATADFFCFEPVSHLVDAHNMDDREAAGLKMLAPGERLTTGLSMEPRAANGAKAHSHSPCISGLP